MAKPKTIETPVPDPSTMIIASPADTLERGWLYYSSKKFDLAIADFQQVLAADANTLDALYGLGLTLKATGANPKALEIFEKVLAQIPNIPDHQKESVLSRLTKGHINQIKTGDWNLEKEVWKSVG